MTPAQLDELAAVLEAGPAAQGWEDQCWTLARVADVSWRRFGAEYTLAGVDVLLHRIGWSVQFPARRAAERDEAAIAAWRAEVWPVVKGPRRTWAPIWCGYGLGLAASGCNAPKAQFCAYAGGEPLILLMSVRFGAAAVFFSELPGWS